MSFDSGGNQTSFRRDPVSVLFDRAARDLLRKAYANPGKWAGTRLQRPTARHIGWAGAQGINLLGRDKSKRAVGRSLGRWAAAFERALYYQHKNYFTGGELGADKRMTKATARALRVQFGKELPAGRGLPAGTAVRIMIMTGGRTAERAVHRMSMRNRIYEPDGTPGAKHHELEDQDW